MGITFKERQEYETRLLEKLVDEITMIRQALETMKL